jgi:hypothetical protein
MKNYGREESVKLTYRFWIEGRDAQRSQTIQVNSHFDDGDQGRSHVETEGIVRTSVHCAHREIRQGISADRISFRIKREVYRFKYLGPP